MPKKYLVEMSPSAESDVLSVHSQIARNNPSAADKWASGIRRQVRSLRILPERFEVIPENDGIALEYRHIIKGNFRIIYRIESSHVFIVRILQASRLLKPGMLTEK